jgi:hypothetical protein
MVQVGMSPPCSPAFGLRVPSRGPLGYVIVEPSSTLRNMGEN